MEEGGRGREGGLKLNSGLEGLEGGVIRLEGRGLGMCGSRGELGG